MSAKPVLVSGFQSVFNLKAKRTPLKYEKKHFNLYYDVDCDNVKTAWQDVSKEMLSAYVTLLTNDLTEDSIKNKIVSNHKFKEHSCVNISTEFDTDMILKCFIKLNEKSLCRKIEHKSEIDWEFVDEFR